MGDHWAPCLLKLGNKQIPTQMSRRVPHCTNVAPQLQTTEPGQGCANHSDQIGTDRWHFLDLGVIELFDVLHRSHIGICHKINCDTFSAKAAAASNAVQVVFHVLRKIVVDYEGHLLDVDPTCKQICGDEHAGRSRTKLPHDEGSFLLVQVCVHRGDCEISFLQLICEEIDFSAGVAIDDCLGDGQCFIQVAECIKLPIFLLDCDVKLLDTFQCELILLDQDSDRIAHELGCKIKDIWSHGGREEAHLDVGGHRLEDVVDLIFETMGEHLVRLVKHEYGQVVHPQVSLAYHVEDAARCSHDEVLSCTQLVNVLTHRSATDTRMTTHLQVISQGECNLLDLVDELSCRCENQPLAPPDIPIDALQHPDDKGRCLPCARLCLANGVLAIQYRLYSALLNRTRLFEAVGVDPTKQVLRCLPCARLCL